MEVGECDEIAVAEAENTVVVLIELVEGEGATVAVIVVVSDAIQCIRCDQFYHTKCSTMSEKTWKWLKTNKVGFACKVQLQNSIKFTEKELTVRRATK